MRKKNVEIDSAAAERQRFVDAIRETYKNGAYVKIESEDGRVVGMSDGRMSDAVENLDVDTVAGLPMPPSTLGIPPETADLTAARAATVAARGLLAELEKKAADAFARRQFADAHEVFAARDKARLDLHGAMLTEAELEAKQLRDHATFLDEQRQPYEQALDAKFAEAYRLKAEQERLQGIIHQFSASYQRLAMAAANAESKLSQLSSKSIDDVLQAPMSSRGEWSA